MNGTHKSVSLASLRGGNTGEQSWSSSNSGQGQQCQPHSTPASGNHKTGPIPPPNHVFMVTQGMCRPKRSKFSVSPETWMGEVWVLKDLIGQGWRVPDLGNRQLPRLILPRRVKERLSFLKLILKSSLIFASRSQGAGPWEKNNERTIA